MKYFIAHGRNTINMEIDTASILRIFLKFADTNGTLTQESCVCDRGDGSIFV